MKPGSEGNAVEEKTQEDPIISIQRVNKSFGPGLQVLRDFTAEIRRQEVVVVIGPSGSGKSTLLRCLNGLEEIDSGTIVIDGIPLDGERGHLLEIRKEVGMVFQSFNLFPHLKVVDNVGLAQRLVLRRDRDAIRETTWRCSGGSALKQRRIVSPHSSAGVSSSGWPLQGPWQ